MFARILHDQSNADYHLNPALGSSYVKDWSLRSPAHAEHGEKSIKSYIADEGAAVHFVFEGKPELVIEGWGRNSARGELGRGQKTGGICWRRSVPKEGLRQRDGGRHQRPQTPSHGRLP